MRRLAIAMTAVGLVLLILPVSALLAAKPTARMPKTPALTPYPWKVQYGSTKLRIGGAGVYVTDSDEGLRKQVEEYFTTRKLPYWWMSSVKETAPFRLAIGAPTDKAIASLLDAQGSKTDFADLGDQGYLLQVRKDGESGLILIVSTGVRGRFYGMQTLKQLTRPVGRGWDVPEALIIDKPTVAVRGVPLGRAWLIRPDEHFGRLVRLKANFIHVHGGSMLDLRMNRRWREPFLGANIVALQDTLRRCRLNHIDASVSIAPMGVIGSKETPSMIFSSPEEFELLKKKIKALYDIGFRTLGLNFDDWQRFGQDVLIHDADKLRYKTLGEAHYDLCRRTYDYIKSLDPANRVIVCPLWYYGIENMKPFQKDYLRSLGKLPKDAIIITTVTDQPYVDQFAELIGRKPLVWDNNYPHRRHDRPVPVVMPPMRRIGRFDNDNIAGYTFLPNGPAGEDPPLVSWQTSMDFAWSPERYDPERSLINALRLSLGDRSARALLPFHRYEMSMQTLAAPLTNEADRMRWINSNTKEFEKWRKRLKPTLEQETFEAIDKTILTYIENLNELKKRQENLPFPVIVRRVKAGAVKLDGKLDEEAWKSAERLTEFLSARNKKGKRPTTAPQQTTVLMVHDGTNLYISAICQESKIDKLVATQKQRDSDVFRDDSIEVFLDTNQDRKTYYQIVVNSTSTVYDATNIRTRDGHHVDRDWNCGVTATAETGKNIWTVELAIPLADLGSPNIAKGARWNFNIGRERWAASAEFSSVIGDFHNPNLFWTLEFAD